MELLLLKVESTEDVHDDLLLLLSRSTTSPSVVDFFLAGVVFFGSFILVKSARLILRNGAELYLENRTATGLLLLTICLKTSSYESLDTSKSPIFVMTSSLLNNPHLSALEGKESNVVE